MTTLSKSQALEIIKEMYAQTNPIKPHEAKIIGHILQTDEPQHEWRFKSHVFCEGCGRELTALDNFLSALEHHTPKFIHDYLYEGANPHGDAIFEESGFPRIQVAKHPISITCIACGVVHSSEASTKCDIYFYQRPVKGKHVISMSEYWHKRIMKTIAEKSYPKKQKE